MQTTVFITPLNFNFSEKNLMLLINIFQIESFSCYKMMTDVRLVYVLIKCDAFISSFINMMI